MTERLPLGEICEFAYGDSLKEGERHPGNVPVFGSNGIVGWHERPLTSGPTIVIGRKGSIGEVNWSSTPCYPIDTTYFIEKTKRPCELKWLYYALLQLDLTRLNKSAAVPGLNRDDAYEERVVFPSLSEQRRLVRLLDQTDRLRCTRGYVLELSDTLLPAAFVELFGDPSVNSGGFEKRSVGDACTRIIDYRGRTPEYASTGIPHVTAACVKEREIKWAEAKRVSEETFAAYMTRGLPEAGDVLFTTEAPLGESAVVRTHERFSLAQRIILLRPTASLLSDYLSCLLGHDRFRRDLLRFATGSTVKGISSEALRAVTIPVPPLRLQEKFVSLVARQERLRAGHREALRQAEHLFQFLLRHAFSVDP